MLEQFIDLILRVLHPMEEHRIVGSDAVGCTRTVHCKPVVVAVLGTQHAQTTHPFTWVVVLSTLEVGNMTRAAILANCPEIKVFEATQTLKRTYYRSNTVRVQISEAEASRQVEMGASSKSDHTSIQK